MIQYIAIACLTLVSLWSHGMEQTSGSGELGQHDLIPQLSIRGANIEGRPLIEIRFNPQLGSTTFPIVHFITDDAKYGTLYLTPLSTIEPDISLEQAALNYLAILSAQQGNLVLLRKTIANGANISALDKRVHNMRFIFKTEKEKRCSYDDVFCGRALARLFTSERPVMAARPYTDSYNWNAVDHAYANMHIHILQELHKHNAQLLLDKNIIIHDLVEQLELEQISLQAAQKNQVIPTFSITSRSYGLNELVSKYDKNMQVITYFNKYYCEIEELTPRSTWKYFYPDIDALAAVYAQIIAVNQEDGEKVINVYHHWEKYKLFTRHVLRYLCDILSAETIQDNVILHENIIAMGEKIVHHLDKNPENESFLAKKFLALSICWSHAQAYDTKNKLRDQQQESSYRDYLDILIKKPFGKEFLKKLCNDNKDALFTPHVKKCIQTRLLRDHCAKILSRGQAPFNKDIAQLIASFWVPDEVFVKALLPKITSKN